MEKEAIWRPREICVNGNVRGEFTKRMKGGLQKPKQMCTRLCMNNKTPVTTLCFIEIYKRLNLEDVASIFCTNYTCSVPCLVHRKVALLRNPLFYMHVIIYLCPYTDADLANIYPNTLYRFYFQSWHEIMLVSLWPWRKRNGDIINISKAHTRYNYYH